VFGKRWRFWRGNRGRTQSATLNTCAKCGKGSIGGWRSHDSFAASSLVMVTLRHSASGGVSSRSRRKSVDRKLYQFRAQPRRQSRMRMRDGVLRNQRVRRRANLRTTRSGGVRVGGILICTTERGECKYDYCRQALYSHVSGNGTSRFTADRFFSDPRMRCQADLQNRI